MSCNCNTNRTSITMQLVPPGTALVSTYNIDILQKLCSRICMSGYDVVYNINFTYIGSILMGPTLGIYSLSIQVGGTITYTPLNTSNCCSKTELINGIIEIPVTSTTGINSVTLTQGNTIGTTVNNGGCGCNSSNLYNIDTILVVTASAN